MGATSCETTLPLGSSSGASTAPIPGGSETKPPGPGKPGTDAHWVPLDRFAPSRAREIVRGELSDELTPERVEDAELAISEVASLFVINAGGVPRAGLAMTVQRADGRVRISVDSTEPHQGPERALDGLEGKVGLEIANAVADRLCLEVEPLRVWFEFELRH
jgi:hypothetical protein